MTHRKIPNLPSKHYGQVLGQDGCRFCPSAGSALTSGSAHHNNLWVPYRLENTLAEIVIEAVPSVEMVRFVNSGTEAFMSVLQLMHAFTSRRKIVKLEGCYHGHADCSW